MKNSTTLVWILIGLAQIGSGWAQQTQQGSGGPILLSKSELQNCPYSLVSGTQFEGTTRLHAVVDSTGRPTAVSVTDSSGSPTLDRAAEECLQRSHFQAALRDGKPVEGEFHIGVKWIIPPSAKTCSASMPVAWEITVAVTPSPTEPEPLPPNAESLVCICVNGPEMSEPVILRSAGPRMDEGAIKLIKQPHRPLDGWTGCYAETFRFKVRPQASSSSKPE